MGDMGLVLLVSQFMDPEVLIVYSQRHPSSTRTLVQ